MLKIPMFLNNIQYADVQIVKPHEKKRGKDKYDNNKSRNANEKISNMTS